MKDEVSDKLMDFFLILAILLSVGSSIFFMYLAWILVQWVISQ